MAQDNFQAFEVRKPQTGKIIQWNDAKGFGWVEPLLPSAMPGQREERIFVHIKSFNRAPRRPSYGEEIRFIKSRDERGVPVPYMWSL